ncbi:MAG: TRAP transporter small permease [Pseudomonadota bacterium]
MPGGTSASNTGLHRAVRVIDGLLLGLGALALLGMMLHISVDVVGNQLFRSPVPLTSALVTHYYMIAVAFLPFASGEYRGAHISVDLVVNRLPAGVQRALDLLVRVLSLAVYVMLTIQSWEQLSQQYATSAFIEEQTTRVSTWPSYIMLPVGFGLMALLVGLKLGCRLLDRPEPAPPVETTEEVLLERYGDV